jgi:RNA polymerase sigma factor (sigma-70 family)
VVAMQEETDADLLLLMSMGDEEAWAEFHRRHMGFVYGALVKRCSQRLTMETIEDVAAETVLRARRYASSYDSAKGNARQWLMGIARRQVANAILNDKRRAETHEVLDGDELWASLSRAARRDLAGASDPGPEDPALTAVREALGDLTERETDILCLSASCFPQRVGTQELLDLATKWGTTVPNIRQVRKRARDKIRKRLRAAGITNLKPQGAG